MWKKILEDKKIRDTVERVGIPLRAPMPQDDRSKKDSEYIIKKDKTNNQGGIDADDEFNIDFNIDKESHDSRKKVKKPEIILR